MGQNNALNHEEIIDQLIDLAPHTKVAYHEPGRIKLQLMLSGLGLFQGTALEELMDTLPGILETRTQWLSRSIIIEYDPGLLSYDLWERMFSPEEVSEETQSLRKRLEEVLSTCVSRGL
jgi:hypothetical protein